MTKRLEDRSPELGIRSVVASVSHYAIHQIDKDDESQKEQYLRECS